MTYKEGQTIIINEKKSNGVGTAGFTLSILALFVGWVPIAGWIVWGLGLLLSFIGIFSSPRGLAITGLLVSILGILILLFLAGIFLNALNV